MPERSVAGTSIVTRRAIVDIVRTAVQSSYGVISFRDPSFGRRMLRWVGLDRPGIRLTTQGGLRLDVYVTVAGGVPVAEVARQVDSAVRYSIRRLIGVDIAGLRIHVDGVGYQPETVRAETSSEPVAPPAEPVMADAVPVARSPRPAGRVESAAGGTASRRRKIE